MLRDYSSEVEHWRLITKLSRVLGIAFILGGLVFPAEGIYLARNLDEPFDVNGVEDHSVEPRLIETAVGCVVAFLGVGLLAVRPYRPDLGDRNALDRFIDPFDTFGERKAEPYRGARAWWTGDPKDS
jgi:hypothetical protein